MRLDARKHDCDWAVWHVPTCQQLKRVVFVDDVAAVWGGYPPREVLGTLPVSLVLENGGLPIIEHQASKIRILPSRRLILIDPIEDNDEEPEEIATESRVIEGASS